MSSICFPVTGKGVVQGAPDLKTIKKNRERNGVPESAD